MPKKLQFKVDIDNPIAVYSQIENQVQFAIASGTIKDGEDLPSVREMSAMLNVNPNTVTKAYHDLDLMALVTTRRGVGVIVAEGARKTCRKSVLRKVTVHLKDAVGECLAAGITPSAIRKVVSKTMAEGYAPYSSNSA